MPAGSAVHSFKQTRQWVEVIKCTPNRSLSCDGYIEANVNSVDYMEDMQEEGHWSTGQVLLVVRKGRG